MIKKRQFASFSAGGILRQQLMVGIAEDGGKRNTSVT